MSTMFATDFTDLARVDLDEITAWSDCPGRAVDEIVERFTGAIVSPAGMTISTVTLISDDPDMVLVRVWRGRSCVTSFAREWDRIAPREFYGATATPEIVRHVLTNIVIEANAALAAAAEVWSDPMVLAEYHRLFGDDVDDSAIPPWESAINGYTIDAGFEFAWRHLQERTNPDGNEPCGYCGGTVAFHEGQLQWGHLDGSTCPMNGPAPR